MALVNITNTAWSAPVTLTSAEVWQVRGGPVWITTDAAETANGGVKLDDGESVRWENGQTALRWRIVSGGIAQISRVPVL